MKKIITPMSRRKMFAIFGKIAPTLPFVGVAVQGLAQGTVKPAAPAGAKTPGKGAADCQPVAATDPVATGLKYVSDGAKAADRPAKMGVEGKNQACSNCQLYSKVTDDAGKCVMIASGCVAAKGWCTAWVKKA